MEAKHDKNVVFFGCPLDSDEKYDSIQDKLNGLWTTGKSDDPLNEVLPYIGPEIDKRRWKAIDPVPVPTWLRPKPRWEDRPRITTKDMIDFIDSNGCKTMADQAGSLVSSRILPDIPCMIGIDHSLSGGVFRALQTHYGKEALSLIVIDSHTDAIPMSALSGAIGYDMENNPESVHDPADPYLYGRPDSYNASSFIHHLIKDKDLDPGKLYVLGVSDYPDSSAFRIKDPRIKCYTSVYTDLKRLGATLVTKKECLLNPKKLNGILKTIRTPYVYISVDMDIGSGNALDGVRFRNHTGFTEQKLYKLVNTVALVLDTGVQLAGMDITEIDQRRAGEVLFRDRDRTFPIAAAIIKKLVFGITP
ncbi:MAG: arginase family protein [Pseudomonadota bacterium]